MICPRMFISRPGWEIIVAPMVKHSRRKVVLGPSNALADLRANALLTIVATVLGGALLLRGPSLHAEPGAATGATEDPAAARAHFKTGSTYYDLGKYDDAIREFEAAYEAKSDPAFLFNLAQAHRLADHPAEALHFYRTYLRYVPDPPNLADIETKMKALEKLAASRPTPPESAPASSQTTATQPPPGTAAGPASEPSAREPTFAAEPPPPPPGGPPVGAPPVLPPDGAGAPTAAAPAPPPTHTPSDQPPVSAPSVSASPAPSVAAHGGEESAAIPGGASRRRLGKILTIVGGSVMVAGALFGIGARVESNKVETATVFDPSVEKRGQSFESLQWVGYILGAVTAGVGVYLLVSPSRPGATPVELVPEAGPHSGGASLRVSFR